MPNPSKAKAFDVDQTSLISLRRAVPATVIELVDGATASSLARDWNPGTVDLLVVKAREEVVETVEPDEVLIADPRGLLTPSQMVDQKLLALIGSCSQSESRQAPSRSASRGGTSGQVDRRRA